MEILSSQLSWILLSLLFAATSPKPGTTGQADFKWLEYDAAKPSTVLCNGSFSFDATPGKEKMHLYKVCQPGARQELEEVIVRLDKHQVIELNPKAKTWKVVDQPTSLSASFLETLGMTAPLKPWTRVSPDLFVRPANDEAGWSGGQGWWMRLQPDASQLLPTTLHYNRGSFSYSFYFTGKPQAAAPGVFEIPAGYKPGK